MRLPFLDRVDERDRLRRALASPGGTLSCLYGRRRCGKSRLLMEVLPPGRSAYYVGDDRSAELQRADLARAVGEVVPGFGQVSYRDWGVLLDQWLRQAPDGAVLAVDEFPSLVAASPELPSLLQKFVDRAAERSLHTVLCGSSQRMMQGLLLDGKAPLFGRARELLKVGPLPLGWLPEALGACTGFEAVRQWAVWGGVPRYWEMARDRGLPLMETVAELILSPLGVLHDEPRRLLLDDLRDTAQASSILALVGRGCHRISELAARLGLPLSSLSRPMARLVELGFVGRQVPFETSHRAGGRSLYGIADPFLRFWFRFVEPNRSLLERGALASVAAGVERDFAHHVGGVFEDLVRSAVTGREVAGERWLAAGRWWGAGRDRRPLEVDVVARSWDGRRLLVGEVKVRVGAGEVPGLLEGLREKAARMPWVDGAVEVVPCLFVADGQGERAGGVAAAEGQGGPAGAVVTADFLVAALR